MHVVIMQRNWQWNVCNVTGSFQFVATSSYNVSSIEHLTLDILALLANLYTYK